MNYRQKAEELKQARKDLRKSFREFENIIPLRKILNDAHDKVSKDLIKGIEDLIMFGEARIKITK
jgi:chromosome segregation ATPase